MTPDRASILLHAYLDGELDAASTIDLENEMKRSPALRQELDRLRALQDRVREVGSFEAPSGLKERVFATLSPVKKEKDDTVPSWWRLWAVGSSAVAAALLVWTAGITFLYPQRTARPTEEVVGAHIRSLMADHLTDLASAERHTIKPWLSNRLDFAPPVPDLTHDGFLLRGARLDYLHGKPVAALVYQRRQHVINVFISRAPDNRSSLSPEDDTERGYNVVRFAARGMSYSLVSDVNTHDLRKLAELLSKES